MLYKQTFTYLRSIFSALAFIIVTAIDTYILLWGPWMFSGAALPCMLRCIVKACCYQCGWVERSAWTLLPTGHFQAAVVGNVLVQSDSRWRQGERRGRSETQSRTQTPLRPPPLPLSQRNWWDLVQLEQHTTSFMIRKDREGFCTEKGGESTLCLLYSVYILNNFIST